MGRSENGPRSWPNNLEAQSAVVAAILRKLLEAGIVKSDLSVDQFLSDIREAGYPEPIDPDGLFRDVMSWLEAEGVIRFGGVSDDGDGGELFHDVVITGHGMGLLGKKIEALGGATAADAIMNAKDRNASASQLVKLGGLVGGIIGGFTKSVS